MSAANCSVSGCFIPATAVRCAAEMREKCEQEHDVAYICGAHATIDRSGKPRRSEGSCRACSASPAVENMRTYKAASLVALGSDKPTACTSPEIS